MAASRVIKLPRDDLESAHVLIQVTQKGPKPLDVKLLGTEGAAPYAMTLKHDGVHELRVANCPVSNSEWQKILQALFESQLAGDIQATASIKDEVSLSITVRKRVQGITQRLGSIYLRHNNNEGIELFEWCGDSIDALTRSKEALAEAKAHAEELENTVKELKSQLDELVTSKQDDETALLMKFRELLNEKKVKIREQQKIIAATPLQSSQPASQRFSQPADSQASRAPGPSRHGKRKARVVESPRRDAEEEEAEDMEVDKIKTEPQDTDREDTAEETASAASEDDDQDDDEGDAAGPSAAGSSRNAPKAPRATRKADEQPPAPRNLPFTRQAKASAKAPEADIQTESDDEL